MLVGKSLFFLGSDLIEPLGDGSAGTPCYSLGCALVADVVRTPPALVAFPFSIWVQHNNPVAMRTGVRVVFLESKPCGPIVQLQKTLVLRPKFVVDYKHCCPIKPAAASFQKDAMSRVPVP